MSPRPDLRRHLPMVHLLAPVGKLNGVACNHYFKRSTPVTTTDVNEVTCRGCLAARPDGPVEHDDNCWVACPHPEPLDGSVPDERLKP